MRLKKLEIKVRSVTKTATSALPSTADREGEDMVLRVVYLARKHKIPLDLIFNADETAAMFVDVPHRGVSADNTMGSVAQGDKRAATLLVCGSASGDLLRPPLVVWNGKPNYTRASVKNADSVVQMQTESHYVSTQVMVAFVTKVLFPHRQKILQQRGIAPDTPCILLLDCCSVHVSKETHKELLDQCRIGGKFPWLIILFVPACCTSRWQPLDVGFFAIFKALLRSRRCLSLLKYCRKLRQENSALPSVKTLGAVVAKQQILECILESYDVMDKKPNTMVSAFKSCGISAASLADEDKLALAFQRLKCLFNFKDVTK